MATEALNGSDCPAHRRKIASADEARRSAQLAQNRITLKFPRELENRPGFVSLHDLLGLSGQVGSEPNKSVGTIWFKGSGVARCPKAGLVYSPCHCMVPTCSPLR